MTQGRPCRVLLTFTHPRIWTEHCSSSDVLAAEGLASLLKEGRLNAFIHIHSDAAQSCLTVCNPKDCSPPGSSIHGILQARILGWIAIPVLPLENPSPKDLPDVGG